MRILFLFAALYAIANAAWTPGSRYDPLKQVFDNVISNDNAVCYYRPRSVFPDPAKVPKVPSFDDFSTAGSIAATAALTFALPGGYAIYGKMGGFMLDSFFKMASSYQSASSDYTQFNFQSVINEQFEEVFQCFQQQQIEMRAFNHFDDIKQIMAVYATKFNDDVDEGEAEEYTLDKMYDYINDFRDELSWIATAPHVKSYGDDKASFDEQLSVLPTFEVAIPFFVSSWTAYMAILESLCNAAPGSKACEEYATEKHWIIGEDQTVDLVIAWLEGIRSNIKAKWVAERPNGCNQITRRIEPGSSYRSVIECGELRWERYFSCQCQYYNDCECPRNDFRDSKAEVDYGGYVDDVSGIMPVNECDVTYDNVNNRPDFIGNCPVKGKMDNYIRDYNKQVALWNKDFNQKHIAPLYEFKAVIMGECAVAVLSNDHKNKGNGWFFNFDKEKVDGILLNNDWSDKVFSVTVVKKNGNEQNMDVRIWRNAGGEGSIGDAHGSKEDSTNGQFQRGDVVVFGENDCKISRSVTVLSNDHKDSANKRFFNFNKLRVDGILGNSHWNNMVLAATVVKENGNEQSMDVRIFRNADGGGSVGDAHGKTHPLSDGNFKRGDVIFFNNADAIKETWQSLDSDEKECAIQDLGGFDGGDETNFFNFDKETVDHILDRTNWNDDIVSVTRVNVEGGTTETMQVKIWRNSARARKYPVDLSHIFRTGDVIIFSDNCAKLPTPSPTHSPTTTLSPTPAPTAAPTPAPSLSYKGIIAGIAGENAIPILSNDHKNKDNGWYFNFNKERVDDILGNTNWHNMVFAATVLRKNGDVQNMRVKIWRNANGEGSIGDAHGRKEPMSNVEFQRGDVIVLKNTYAIKQVWQSLNSDQQKCAIQDLGEAYDEKKRFSFDKERVNNILGSTNWNANVFSVTRVSVVSGAMETMQIKMFFDTARGRKDPSSANGNFKVGDVIIFSDDDCKVLPSNGVPVLGNEPDGYFFNFDRTTVDDILGNSDWDNLIFSVTVVKANEDQHSMKVVLFRRANSFGSTGDAYGRSEPVSYHDFEAGDVIFFDDTEPIQKRTSIGHLTDDNDVQNRMHKPFVTNDGYDAWDMFGMFMINNLFVFVSLVCCAVCAYKMCKKPKNVYQKVDIMSGVDTGDEYEKENILNESDV